MGAVDGLFDDLEAQRQFVSDRAPTYARVLGLLSGQIAGDIESRLEASWRGRAFGAWYERPLLLLAALREDALRAGPSHPLFAAIGEVEPDPEAATPSAVAAALSPDRDHVWRSLRERSLQTNESSRAIAWMWPAHLSAEVAPDRPLAIVDVGASAGLNLVADALAPVWRRRDGHPLAVDPRPPIAQRVGYDARPLDALAETDARWLRACIWPDQRERLARFDDALAAFRARQGQRDAPAVSRARAADVPPLLPREGDHLVLVYQTVVRDYLSDDERAAYRDGMRRWLRARAPGTALWVELENEPTTRHGDPPAVIAAHIARDGDLAELELAHCEPHPRDLAIDDAAVDELRGALTP